MSEVKLYSIVYEGCGTETDEAICVGFFRTYERALEELTRMHEMLSIPDNQTYDIHKCDKMIRVCVNNGVSTLGDDVDEESNYMSTNSSGKSYGYIEGLSIIQVVFE